MDTNITKTWAIDINEDRVFSMCTNESLYQAYVRADENSKGDAIVMQDDDRQQFKMYFANAIANLHMLLARRMAEPVWDYCGCCSEVSFYLQMTDNHDDNILPILKSHCYEYVVRQILEQWYHRDFGSQIEKLDINHCLHYRKNPVRRRVNPVF